MTDPLRSLRPTIRVLVRRVATADDLAADPLASLVDGILQRADLPTVTELAADLTDGRDVAMARGHPIQAGYLAGLESLVRHRRRRLEWQTVHATVRAVSSKRRRPDGPFG